MTTTRPSWRAFETPFVSGRLQPDNPTSGLPLDRFLPPWYEGMASRWLNNYASPGSWVLDPYGQSPFSVLELARTGYRVLVTANNPISAFIIEVLASAPSLEAMQTALFNLGESKSSQGQSLKEQVQSHYLLPCPNPACSSHDNPQQHHSFEVDRYIWNEDQPQPHLAIGKCLVCGLEAERDITPEIYQKLPVFPPIGMIRAKVLEKTASPTDPLRAVMEDVVGFYTDRALSLLQIILGRIESLSFNPRQKKLMQALFLSAADKGNQLWTHPQGRTRPKQLTRPPVFQEYNLWKALEAGCEQWAKFDKPVHLRPWPDKLPKSGGISLFKGRLRELSPALDKNQIDIIYANLPRRNHAWWNLSGLWSGWLWGREGIQTLRNSLLKQRYDWTWHSTALEKVLVRLNDMVRPTTSILLQISELDPLFVLASVKAAQYAGFNLHSAASSGNVTVLQTAWKRSPTKIPQTSQVSPNQIRQKAKEIAKGFLAIWGEAAGYPRLFSQLVLGLQTQNLLFQNPEEQATLPINKVQEDLDPVFTDSSLLQRYNPGVTSETGNYWLVQPPENYTALADSVEDLIRQEFLHTDTISALDIATAVNNGHPGLMTPETDLVQNVLRSYALIKESENESHWTLNEHENFTTRHQDIKAIRKLIENIALRLDFKRQLRANAIYFLDEHDQALFSFFVTGSAIISETLHQNHDLPGKKLIVLPGSRANLISYKLRRDQSLQALLKDDWHFVKFRQIRNLHDNPLLNRELFASQILGDPPEYQSSQLALF